MSLLRIVYLADASSVHTRRWANHFAQAGHEVHVISFLPATIPQATVYHLDAGPVRSEGGNWRCALHLPQIRRLVRQIRPHVLHAHYLTSYGLLAAMLGFHPLVATAWGSDVLVTAKASWLHRLTLTYVLRAADLVTSDALALNAALASLGLKPEHLITVPFGVDLARFNMQGRSDRSTGNRLVSTRYLVPNTNLETVLEAIQILGQRFETPVELRVAGDGPERGRLQDMAARWSISQNVQWLGNVAHDSLPSLLRESDIFLAVTLSDSTSVSLLEAMACGLFPVVSDLPANREWVETGVSGTLVPSRDPQALAAAISSAVGNPELRARAALRNFSTVTDRGDWQKNMATMEAHYLSLAARGMS